MAPFPTRYLRRPEFLVCSKGAGWPPRAGRSAPGRRLLNWFCVLMPLVNGRRRAWRSLLLSLPQGDTLAVHGAACASASYIRRFSGHFARLTVPEGPTRASNSSTALGVTFPFQHHVWGFRFTMALMPTGFDPLAG